MFLQSLPMRERGLKWKPIAQHRDNHYVAPHAGAWIEILAHTSSALDPMSLPMRERGLKYH